MIAPEHSARFVWRMEGVLDLYEGSHDEKRPVVCFDERPCQLFTEVREVLRPGAVPSAATTSTGSEANDAPQTLSIH